VSQYIGQSEYALSAVHLGSQIDQWRRLERAQEQRDLEKFIQELRQVDQSINENRAQVRQVVAAVLHPLGYRKHKGQWRKARKVKELDAAKVTLAEYNEFQGLLDAADKEGAKQSVLNKAKQYAQAHPGLFDGTTAVSHNTLISVMNSVKMNPSGKIYFEGEAAALRRSLGEATATPLEKLLIQDIAICWLRLQLMEQVYSLNYSSDNLSIAKADYLERRLSATHKRYLQSVETLARVRRLLSRAGVQINVAGQQVVVNG